MNVSIDTNSRPTDSTQVRSLYAKLLDRWNQRDAGEYASLFADNGNLIGFDGSQVNGRQEICAHLSEIFQHHETASYVSIVKEVRHLDAGVWVLRAVAGMVPPGKPGINPAVNAIQTLVAIKSGNDFRIAVFQNTPAAFHGRPEASEQLTRELQDVLQKQKNM